jgi:hypothetical protein
MTDYTDGQRVRVRKNPAQKNAVKLEGQRDIEIGDEPIVVGWSGYYHQLRAEGAILCGDLAEPPAPKEPKPEPVPPTPDTEEK